MDTVVEILRTSVEIKIGIIISFCAMSAAMGVSTSLFIHTFSGKGE
jgi:hypothetical protein